MPKKENKELIEILTRLTNVENNVELLKELVKLQNNYINNELLSSNKEHNSENINILPKESSESIDKCINLQDEKNKKNKLREDKYLRRRTVL